MRYGIKTSPQETTYDAMKAVWQAADEIDLFESAWNFDHFYPIFSDSLGPCMEGWVTLSALAEATSRIRIGCLVTGIVYRHPAVLANMAATLDIVSEGRLELGIGAGWNEEELNAYGIELGSLTTRFDRLDEGLTVIDSLLRNEWTDFQGEHFTLTRARCEPKGPQRPRVPITIGGAGRKRTLRAAARFADHWNHPGGTPEVIAEAKAVLHQHCADVGRDPSEILTSCHVRYDEAAGAQQLVDTCAALEGVVDMAVVYVPTPHTPEKVGIIADALGA
ncbi:MAG: class F420-dependent oxidoreductase [Acidimicrobiales bacterium]|nr:class F420-dependent oxidoreductase [Acidimicrobiales bacterium]